MLKKRLVAVLTFNNGVLFRTKNFCPDYRYTLNFVDAWSIDEIVALDITRYNKDTKNDFYLTIKEFTERCFVPLAVGGGVKTIEDFKTTLALGADKVVINTEAVKRPEFIEEAARLYGSQCVVVSIDAKKNSRGNYEVLTEYGTRAMEIDPVAWAKRAQDLGAGEIMITSIDRDGSLEGYDNDLNQLVSEAVDIPVLVCGGAGRWQHFVDGFIQGGASAVCTTNIFHFTETSIKSAKAYLKNKSIDIRI